jgi:hypothetical protein
VCINKICWWYRTVLHKYFVQDSAIHVRLIPVLYRKFSLPGYKFDIWVSTVVLSQSSDNISYCCNVNYRSLAKIFALKGRDGIVYIQYSPCNSRCTVRERFTPHKPTEFPVLRFPNRNCTTYWQRKWSEKSRMNLALHLYILYKIISAFTVENARANIICSL